MLPAAYISIFRFIFDDSYDYRRNDISYVDRGIDYGKESRERDIIDHPRLQYVGSLYDTDLMLLAWNNTQQQNLCSAFPYHCVEHHPRITAKSH